VTRRCAALALLALGACGLTPVYGTGGTGAALQNKTAFQTPATVAGFAMRTHLETRLGVATGPQFELVTTLSETRDAAAVTSDGDITRFRIVGTSTWVLMQGEATLATGAVETFTSYAATGSTVATQAAESDAVARLSVALAELIIADLLLADL